MIHFVLNDLRLKIPECLLFPFELSIQIFYHDHTVPFDRTLSRQRQTAFFGLVALFGMIDDLRIYHDEIVFPDLCRQNGLPLPDHIRRHPYTAVGVRTNGIQQVLYHGQILSGCQLGFLAEEKCVFYNFTNHLGISYWLILSLLYHTFCKYANKMLLHPYNRYSSIFPI